MRKRLLSTLLALCMVLALLPGTALAADDPSPEDLKIAETMNILRYCNPDELHGPLTRMQVAELLASLCYYSVPSVEPENFPYTDCDNLTSEQRDIIVALRDDEIMFGYSDLTFKPEATITRAEVAALLMRTIQNVMRGPENVDLTTVPPYNDVLESSWYYEFFMYLAAVGAIPTGGYVHPLGNMAAGDILPWMISAAKRFDGPYASYYDIAFLSGSQDLSPESISGGSQEYVEIEFGGWFGRPGDWVSDPNNWDIDTGDSGLTFSGCIPSQFAYIAMSPSFEFTGHAKPGSKLVFVGKPGVVDWTDESLFGPREILLPKHSAIPLDVQFVMEGGIPTAVTWRVELADDVYVPDEFEVIIYKERSGSNNWIGEDNWESWDASKYFENTEQPGILAIEGPVRTSDGKQVYTYTYTLGEDWGLSSCPDGSYSLTVDSISQYETTLYSVGLGAPWENRRGSNTAVSGKLDSIIDDVNASAEAVKSALESIADDDLSAAIQANPSIFDKIDTLEKRIDGSAEITVDAGLGFTSTSVNVTGAKLNRDYSKNVRLEIGQPENSTIPVPDQDSAKFRFSMKLIEGENNNVAELTVPIRVTMPIPAQRLKPQSLKLWHFHGGKLEPVTLTTSPYQANGQWYVSFMLSGFSDLIMTYEEEVPVQPGVSHTVAFDTGNAPVTVASMVTGTDGRLASLPAPVWSGHRFEGWYLADGTRVTTSTVFTGDTTVSARWTRTVSMPETNFVSLPPAEHGKIITADRFAAEGDRVNLSVHPDDGYTLASLTVTAIGGKEITLRERSEGKYSFTMPDRQVKVIAEFEKIQ